VLLKYSYLMTGRSAESFFAVTMYALATLSEWKTHQAGYCSIHNTERITTVHHHVAYTVFVPFQLLD